MQQWIVFDEGTAAAVRQHGGSVDEQKESSVAEAIQDAAGAGKTVVIVVPAGEERATVARITPQADR